VARGSGSAGVPASYTVTAVQDSSKTCTVTGVAGNCSITGLANGTQYTFTATATNLYGTSAASAASNAVTPQVFAPNAPTTPVAAAGNATATVTVAAGTGPGGAPASFTVTAVQDNTKSCVVTGTSGSCDVTGLTNGTAYSFTATATNAGGTSGVSAMSNSVTPVPPPASPAPPTAVAGDTLATVTVAPAGIGSAAEYFTVTAVQDATKTCVVTGAAGGSCDVTGLANGTLYTFTATATNAGGTSAASGASTGVTPQIPGPSAPSTPTVVAGDTLVTVTVSPGPTGTAPASYLVTAYDAGVATAHTCTVTGAAGSCDVTGLTNGVAYTFKATATNAGGTSPSSLASTSATPQVPLPGVPSIVTVVPGDAQATVTVAAAGTGGAPSSYTVTAVEDPLALCTITAPAVSCVVTGLTNGTAYTFTASATNAAGTSVDSAPTASPVTPLFAALTPTFGTPVRTADGYTVQISNYDAVYTWTPGVTVGAASINAGTGVVTVTGLGANVSSTLTVTTSRTNYSGGTASVSASSLNAALTPVFGTPTPTADGFTVQVTNYDGVLWSWPTPTVTGGVGSATIDGSGLVTVTGLAAGATETVTVTNNRPGYVNGTANQAGTAIP